ncbi:MAG: nitrilase-related carbon-nitrogen hydrolase [Leptospirales bacterium]
MRLYLNQFNLHDDIENNFQQVLEVFEKSSLYDLIVSPEVFTSGFQYKELSSISKKNKDFIHTISNQCRKHSTAFCGSLFWKEKKKYTNRAFFIDDQGDIISMYDKVHLIPTFRENEFLHAGKKTSIIKYKELYIGLAICYDLRFPELFRKYAKKEVDAIIIMAQWPQERKDHMIALAKARAIENQCYIILVNTIGKSGKTIMAGNSMVIHPKGDILLNLGSAQTGKDYQVHLAEILKWRAEFPVLYQYSRPRLFPGSPSKFINNAEEDQNK